jgi:hypothetical protein
VIEQQLDLPRRAVQDGDRQGLDAFLKRGASNRQRIDRFALARLARPAPAASHQLRRHPHHPVTPSEQEPLQLARHMPAILDRPHPVAANTPRPPSRHSCPALVACTVSLLRSSPVPATTAEHV